jgi:hypothetical protein
MGAYIGYIRVGLAEGGENQPICTVTSGNAGIWPSPEGLNFDLNTQNGVSPDWFVTTPNCTGDSDCQGKYAYIAGNPGSQHDGPGYVKTMFDSFFQSLQSSGASWQIMSNIHDGPPNNSDTTYDSLEAPIYVAVQCQGSCNSTGFGMQTFSEYDLHYNPNNSQSEPCGDLWCYLFGIYHSSGTPNLYLQSTEPNNAVTYQISKIEQTGSFQTVTCSSTCTNFPSGLPADPGQPLVGLYAQEGFSLTTGSGPNKLTYRIVQQRSVNGVATQGIIATNKFTCDTSVAPCPVPFSGSMYVGDYLPDTIPFASANYAQTIEVYFCDWEFAYNNNSTTATFCQGIDSANSLLYQHVLNTY